MKVIYIDGTIMTMKVRNDHRSENDHRGEE